MHQVEDCLLYTSFNSGMGKLKWKAVPSDPWILVNKKSGATYSEERINVSVDWSKVPVGESVSGSIDISSGSGEKQTVFVSVFNPETPSVEELKGLYVENNG